MFWVGLAQLRMPFRTLGAKNGLAEHIGERELLLLLDNLEQVVAAAAELAALVERCPNLVLLVTSREVLRVRGGEFRWDRSSRRRRLSSLRARWRGAHRERSGTCRTLDDLPLALELAAARARYLRRNRSSSASLVGSTCWSGGRQQTLRATIEWSHELLDADERRFARLAVFTGGCALEAAEDLADADVDSLFSRSVEKSCSVDQQGGSGCWRRSASTRASGSLRPERWTSCSAGTPYFLEQARRQDEKLRAGEPEELHSGPEIQEIDNLRAAVQLGLESGQARFVREITAALPMYWTVRGRYIEARSWLERAGTRGFRG